MDQTSLIIAALLFAFLIFITVKGQLPSYIGLVL